LVGPRVPQCSVSWLPEKHAALTHMQRKLNSTSVAWLRDRRGWIPMSLVAALALSKHSYG